MSDNKKNVRNNNKCDDDGHSKNYYLLMTMGSIIGAVIFFVFILDAGLDCVGIFFLSILIFNVLIFGSEWISFDNRIKKKEKEIEIEKEIEKETEIAVEKGIEIYKKNLAKGLKSDLKCIVKNELEAEIKKEQLEINHLNGIIESKPKDKASEEKEKVKNIEARNKWRKEMLEKYN